MALWFFFGGGGRGTDESAQGLSPPRPPSYQSRLIVWDGERQRKGERGGEKEQHVVCAVLYKCGKVPPLSHTALVVQPDV